MTKREQILLTAVGILFALVGIVYGYQYLNERTETAERNNTNLLMQQSDALGKIAALPALADGIAATEADIATARENLSDFVEDEELQRVFVAMAEDLDMSCTELSVASNDALYGTGDANQTYEAKELRLSLTGTYDQFIALVDKASARNNTVIESFSQSIKSTDADGVITESFDVTFVIYMATETDGVA